MYVGNNIVSALNSDSPNYFEVGGPDTAIMYAVGNALASIPGLVLPPLGVYLARVANGSWTPLFGTSHDDYAIFGLFSASRNALVNDLVCRRVVFCDHDGDRNCISPDS